MYNIKCYYINLKRRQDRNNKIIDTLKILNKYNIPIERINAIDWKDLNYNDLVKDNYITKNNTLRLGQIACIMSHNKTWKYFKKSAYNYALILEDDIKFNNDYFNDSFKNIIDTLSTINFDWLYLGRNYLLYKNFYTGEQINKYFYKPGHPGRGAHGYILSKSGANKLIKYYSTTIHNIPLDAMEIQIANMKHNYKINFNILSIKPYYLNNNINKSKFSDDFMIYPINISDSDTRN